MRYNQETIQTGVKTLGKENIKELKNLHRNAHDKYAFSLIVPVYKEEKILAGHLQLFNKDLRKQFNFELIVSDGGSDDQTASIAEMFADKVVVHDRDYRQTISEGRNRGAEVADSEILVFLNADSVPKDLEYFLNYISKWAAEDEKNAGSAIACYVTAFPDEMLFKDKVFYSLHNAYVSLLNKLGLGMGRGECQIVRRNAFYKVNGYNPHIAAGEDFDLYRRINKFGKIFFEKNIKIYESPRRFRKYGYIKTVLYWTLNSLTVWFFGKSVSKEWEAVR